MHTARASPASVQREKAAAVQGLARFRSYRQPKNGAHLRLSSNEGRRNHQPDVRIQDLHMPNTAHSLIRRGFAPSSSHCTQPAGQPAAARYRGGRLVEVLPPEALRPCPYAELAGPRH